MTRINLLPPEERSRAAREQGLLLTIVGLIVLVVALGAVYFMSVRQVSAKQDQVNTVAAQVDVANVQLAALKPYAALQVQRQAMTLTATQILNSRIILSNVLEEVSLLIPSGVSLAVDEPDRAALHGRRFERLERQRRLQRRSAQTST